MAKRRDAGLTDKGKEMVSGRDIANAVAAESKGTLSDGSHVLHSTELPGAKIGQSTSREQDLNNVPGAQRAPDRTTPIDDDAIAKLAAGVGADDYEVVTSIEDKDKSQKGTPSFEEAPAPVRKKVAPIFPKNQQVRTEAAFEPFIAGQDMFLPQTNDVGAYTLLAREVKNTLGDWQKYSLIQNETLYFVRTGVKYNAELLKNGYSVKTPDHLFAQETITVDKISNVRGEMVVYFYCHGRGFDMKQGAAVAELHLN